MLESGEDVVKRRLVDRAQIAAVVDYMRVHGLDTEVIAIELARMFYVDMDELNSVLTASVAAPAGIVRPAASAGSPPH